MGTSLSILVLFCLSKNELLIIWLKLKLPPYISLIFEKKWLILFIYKTFEYTVHEIHD